MFDKARIAEIVPVSCLKRIKDKEYHMGLAHLALQSKEYASFYKEQSLLGHYVIMDNGACEGEALTFEELLNVYELTDPTEIILPDKLWDGEVTFNKSISFYEKAKDLKRNMMIVPQGKDFEEWKYYAEQMIKYMPLVTCIGIPKWLGSKDSSTRVEAVKHIGNLTNKDIHLLGCSEGPAIVKRCREVNENVRGCDSAFAYIACKGRVEGIDFNTTRPKGVIEFLEDPDFEDLNKYMDQFERAALY